MNYMYIFFYQIKLTKTPGGPGCLFIESEKKDIFINPTRVHFVSKLNRRMINL